MKRIRPHGWILGDASTSHLIKILTISKREKKLSFKKAEFTSTTNNANFTSVLFFQSESALILKYARNSTYRN